MNNNKPWLGGVYLFLKQREEMQGVNFHDKEVECSLGAFNRNHFWK